MATYDRPDGKKEDKAEGKEKGKEKEKGPLKTGAPRGGQSEDLGEGGSVYDSN